MINIEEGLEASDFLIIILSKNSVNSSWVRKELNAFLCDEISSENVKVLLALIDDCCIPIFLIQKNLCVPFMKYISCLEMYTMILILSSINIIKFYMIIL